MYCGKYPTTCASGGYDILSSSLLELQPYKVVTAEAKSMTEKNPVTDRYSYNNNHRFNDTRTHSIPGLNEAKSEWNGSSPADSKIPLSAIRKTTQEQFNGHGNSISCDNIFESPLLQVSIPDESTPKHTPDRSISVEYDPSAKHGNSLPKPITRSSSKEMLLVNETPNHAPLEPKKTKPKKPNRESLRRSRPDIRASHPNLPSHRSSSIATTSPEHNLTVPGPATLPGHDYEELNTDIKILQQRHRVSQQQLETSPILKIAPSDLRLFPSASQNQPSPALPERTRNPRQRLNPLYAGMHSNPYERESSSAESKMQRPPIWCLRCLVVGVVFAIILSVLCAAAIALLFIGYHEPFAVFADDSPSEESILIENLQREISMLKNNSNLTQAHINQRLSETKNELLDAVKSLNISALKGPDTADVAQCIYNSIEIGNSRSQDTIRSGEYFPEKGFVTTGVTCSASTGYIPYLNVRNEEYFEDSDEGASATRSVYECICHKTSLLNAIRPSGERVVCRIHYWQCPTL